MDKIYANKSNDRRAEIDAVIATASADDMSLARDACDAIVGGRYFDFDELKADHPKAHQITMLFMAA